MSEQARNKRYRIELGSALALYAVVLVGSIGVGRQMPVGALQTSLFLAPMVPMLLGVWAIARHLRRVDEFMRLRTLEQLAIAAAVTAGWTFTYGFLENGGFPRLSMFVVWPVMGAVWGALELFGMLRARFNTP